MSDPAKILAQAGGSVPRYTSYPTAPHFTPGLGSQVFSAMIASLHPQDQVSLYMHIPFCDRLCWFCGCHTKHTLKHAPVAAYVEQLVREIALVGSQLAYRRKLGNLHLGGGSPSLLNSAEFRQIRSALEAHFDLLPDAGIAIEIDPSDANEDFFEGLQILGVNRASIGVQDFNDDVQKAINRPQSFELTFETVRRLRAAGIGSINIDALYGLPLQTEQSLAATLTQVLEMAPDRVALFGYAHVPWVKKHQNLINANDLPGPMQRYQQASAAAAQLAGDGLVAIGIDHFARPADQLAIAARAGTLRRNFQGYTADNSAALIGIGASAIHSYDGGFVQNIVPTSQYQACVKSGVLPAARGCQRTLDDRMRGEVIEQLMCNFGFSFAKMHEKFKDAFDPVRLEAETIAANDRDGLCTIIGDRFQVNEAARPFTRILASKFDAWIAKAAVRYSAAV